MREPGDRQRALSQWMTPPWAAEALVEQYFPDLGSSDMVIEPSCGTGAFLQAIPAHVPAIGIEIDEDLAALARRHTGRRVIVGDYRMVDLPMQATAIIGNPPFSTATIREFLDRSWHLLPDGGRLGMILPCFVFQTPSSVERLSEHWGIRQDILPRNLFGKLSYPVCFAQLTKGRRRELFGFALYHEQLAVQRLQKRYKQLLASGEGSAWAAVTRAALEALGGRARLEDLYREIEGHRPTANKFWQAKVRQQLQRIGRRVDAGVWELEEPMRKAA